MLFVPTLIGASLVIFAIMRIIPGDVALMILMGEGGEQSATQDALAMLRAKLGTDKPLYEQYGRWMWGLISLNPGNSYWTDEPITKEMQKRFPLTLQLVVLAILFSIMISIPIGVLSALKQDTWVDYVFRVVSILGVAMPTFWTGTLVILFLVLWFRWMPPLGYVDIWKDPFKNLQQIIFPVIVMGYYLTAVNSRMTRSCMLEVMREDYIRTARAKGLREMVVVMRHALKNAVLPLFTLISIEFGHMLGGSVIMETVFTLPGMGRNLVDSIFHRDYPMVQSIIVLLVFIFLFINLAVDLAYAWLDPRIRYA